jgi:hypothetical protein
MATIIDKLLNRRESDPKPTAEELRQVAELAQEESARLAELIEQAQRELRSEHHGASRRWKAAPCSRSAGRFEDRGGGER